MPGPGTMLCTGQGPDSCGTFPQPLMTQTQHRPSCPSPSRVPRAGPGLQPSRRDIVSSCMLCRSHPAPPLSVQCQSTHCLPSPPHRSGPALCWLPGISLVPVLQRLLPTELQARKTLGSGLPCQTGSFLGWGKSPGFLLCLIGFS